MTHRIGLRIACTAFAIGMLSVLAIGCGDDSEDDGDVPTAGTPAGGAGAGGARAGSGGAGAGGAGAGGRSGAGGSAGMPPPAMCGTPPMACPTVMSAQGPLPSCCDMDDGGACGAIVDAMTMACEATGQMGTIDTSCPNAMSVIGSVVPGCCKPDGTTCGVMSMTLMGCIEREDYPPMFLMGGMALTAATCGGDTDAGM